MIEDDFYTSEDFEENVGCAEAAFITKLCFQIPKFTERVDE